MKIIIQIIYSSPEDLHDASETVSTLRYVSANQEEVNEKTAFD